jgi:hypothetical protein
LVPLPLVELLSVFDVLLSAGAVTAEADPDVPPQAASATVRLTNNTDQASRSPPKLRLASFMRPLDYDFVAGRAGRSHQFTRDAQRHSSQMLTGYSHEACDRPGNPAVIGLRAVRPEVLRPRLSTGLLFGDAGYSSVAPDECRACARIGNPLRVLKYPAQPKTSREGAGGRFVAGFPDGNP